MIESTQCIHIFFLPPTFLAVTAPNSHNSNAGGAGDSSAGRGIRPRSVTLERCDSTTVQRTQPITGVISRSATPRAQKFRPVLLHGRSPSQSLTSHTFRRTWRHDCCQWRTRAKRYGHPCRGDALQHRPSELRQCRNLAHGKKHKIDTARRPSESKSRQAHLLLPLHAHRSKQLEVFPQSFAMYAAGQVPPVRFEHERLASRRTRSLPTARAPITGRLVCCISQGVHM
jgi:hypothetical protein